MQNNNQTTTNMQITDNKIEMHAISSSADQNDRVV